MPLPSNNKFFEQGTLAGYTPSSSSLVKVERFFRDQRSGLFYDPPDGRYLAVLDNPDAVNADGTRKGTAIKQAAYLNGYFKSFSLQHADNSITHGGDGAYLEVQGSTPIAQGKAIYIVYAFVVRDWQNDFAVLEFLPNNGPSLAPVLIHSVEEQNGQHSRPIEGKPRWYGFYYAVPQTFNGTLRIAMINGQHRSSPTADVRKSPSCLLVDSIDIV